MTFRFDASGLSVQTFDEVLADWHAEAQSRIHPNIATNVKSWLGQVWYIGAKLEHAVQEKCAQLFASFDHRLAEGASLDARIVGALGIVRDGKQRAEVIGTAAGVDGTVIPNLSRLTIGGYVFEVVDGPHTIVSLEATVRLRSVLYQPIDVSALGAWEITDAIAGFDTFTTTAQPIAGRVVETDAAYRVRAEAEKARRALGPLGAIDSGVGNVLGVGYVKAYENVNPATTNPDADGIDLWAVNVVVDGGEDLAVAEAIELYGSAGTVYQGAVQVALGSGSSARLVGFDRVTDVEITIRATFTTSTHDDADQALSPADLLAATQAALLTFTTSTWAIGVDVIPAALSGALTHADAGIPAIDALLIEVDSGSGYQSTKIPISIRERAAFSVARVVVVEN